MDRFPVGPVACAMDVRMMCIRTSCDELSRSWQDSPPPTVFTCLPNHSPNSAISVSFDVIPYRMTVSTSPITNCDKDVLRHSTLFNLEVIPLI